MRVGQSAWTPAMRGDVFELGDSLRVLAFGRAAVLLPDDTVLRLDQETTVVFTRAQDEGARSWLELLRGVVHIISRGRNGVEVLTPFGNAGIEGTEFVVTVTEDETRVTVFEGAVAMSNQAGAATATSGQEVSARMGQTPIAQTVVRPRDAVQWALYYEPILDRELPSPDAQPTPAQANASEFFYTGRAASLLSVGRVDEARADLMRALALAPDNPEVPALESIVALSQNDKDEALRLANLAVSRAPESPAALIALSYARQAFFDVSGALTALQDAVQAAPDSAHAWARAAELWLAVGDVEQAVRAAEMAVALDPNVSRTQSVLGFVRLAEVDIEVAVAAFDQAIALDQAAPLPRLGLGLALIRDGELEAGRREIETAVILDPGNALIRSYMGKAYYEEKRNELAAVQLDMAAQLDPLDPTAPFYDAIRAQTSNRPVEALLDLERSIELNDNRAVYRSRLLLDEDLAARSASLGRVYADLGFEQLALLEGWKSVNADPANYSGHRFLSDVYRALPNHQIARVNELFRSQMLQPLNITPIQPQLAEANIFILETAGPSSLSFNEFNPLFSRNRVAFQGSGVVAGNDTWGDDIVVSGIANKLSYSLGQFHFETDGFRENNDLEQDVANAFFQYRVSTSTSVLAEIRTTEIERGDLRLLSDPLDFNPDVRQGEDVDSARIGVRHAFNPGSTLLASILRQEANLSIDDLFFSAVTDYDTWSADLQHIQRLGRWNLTSGLNQTEADLDEVAEAAFPLPIPERTIATLKHSNAYLYANVTTLGDATLTIGVSYDDLDTEDIDDTWLNGKIGVMWPVSPATTLRAAAFRTVQGPVISRQNIQPRLEPSQVAGFNQFFFASEGERTRRYGVGIDHEFSDRMYAGIELSKRDIELTITDVTVVPRVSTVYDLERQAARAYLYLVPRSDMALSIELQHEDSDNNEAALIEGFAQLKTLRVPLEVRYFHGNGFSASFTATWVDQEGTFEDPFAPIPIPLERADSFWTADASLQYRLPRRHGLVTASVNNLFDEEFAFQDVDPENPRILPERFALLRFTLSF